MKKTFNISTVDSLSFIGTKDQNIRLIEKSFKSKIVVRGSRIIVDGAKKEIDILNLLINDMLVTINKKAQEPSRGQLIILDDKSISACCVQQLLKNCHEERSNLPFVFFDMRATNKNYHRVETFSEK